MNKKTVGILVAVLVIVLVAVFAVVTINNKPEEKGDKDTTTNNEPLTDLMTKMYANIPKDNLPLLATTQVDAENVEYYLGTSDIKFEEAIASEPMMSSIAHSVVLVRVADGEDPQIVATKIKENVDPAKWICVQVESQNVKVEVNGNLVALIMDNEVADQILENFKGL